jgi:hypothetical protein
MSEPANYRMERVERLLRELEYEVTRGMIEGDLDETLGFTFIVPISKAIPRGGVVRAEFRTRPVIAAHEPGLLDRPRLVVVKNDR